LIELENTIYGMTVTTWQFNFSSWLVLSLKNIKFCFMILWVSVCRKGERFFELSFSAW